MNIVLDVLRYLNEHDITLVKAAEATGVAQQNIKKSIGNNPKTSTLLALAKGLGVDPREFFYDLDEKEDKGKNTGATVFYNSNSTDEANTAEEGANDKNDTTKETKSFDASYPTAEAETHELQLPRGQPIVNTTAFCPHCGAKVRVGVILMPE